MKILGNLKLCGGISIVLIVISLIMNIAGVGMNMGIDFTGGIITTYHMGGDFEVADIEEAIRSLGVSEMQVAKSGEEGNEDSAIIRLKSLDTPEEDNALRRDILAKMQEIYPEAQVVSTDSISAVAGQELVWNAVQSLLVATLLMLLYIGFRFDLFSGIAAVIGLLHDVLIMVAFMSFFRGMIQVNSPFIAALLTIVGYSINNTIVIFDRVRENQKKGGYREKGCYLLVQDSVKQSLSRTISTSLTTLFTIVSLYIFGVDSIREFAFPIIVGILAGIYSSNLINGFVWSELLDLRAKYGGNKKGNKKRVRTLAI